MTKITTIKKIFAALSAVTLLSSCSAYSGYELNESTGTAQTTSFMTEEITPEVTTAKAEEPSEESPKVKIILPPQAKTVKLGDFYEKNIGVSCLVGDSGIVDSNTIYVKYTLDVTDEKTDKIVFHEEIRLFDIKSGTEKLHIVLPEGKRFSIAEKCCNDNILCRFQEYDYYKKITPTVAEVYDDYSCKIFKTTSNLPVLSCGNNEILSSGCDITDENGKILVKGEFYDYDSKGNHWQRFSYPIDENRFVYLTGGYEWTYGFGFYDYAADKATDFPETNDCYPIGVRNGKIYSVYCCDVAYAGLFVSDPQTLKTERVFEKELDSAEISNIYMSPDGSVITVVYYDNSVILLDTDTAEILGGYEFYCPYLCNPIFVDDKTIAYLNWGLNELYLIDFNDFI